MKNELKYMIIHTEHTYKLLSMEKVKGFQSVLVSKNDCLDPVHRLTGPVKAAPNLILIQ